MIGLIGLGAWLIGPSALDAIGDMGTAIFRPVGVAAVVLFNRPAVIYVLSGVLLLMAVAFCFAYWVDVASKEKMRLSRLRREVAMLAPADGPGAPSVAQALDALGDVLRSHGLFLMAYDSIMTSRRANGRLPEAPFQTLVHVRDWRMSGTQREFYAALPGYFTSVGLLLTFIGLVAALFFAARGFESGSAEQAKAAILQLLSASSFKFLTSVAALAGAILISMTVRAFDAGVRRAAYQTAETIETHLAGCRTVERKQAMPVSPVTA